MADDDIQGQVTDNDGNPIQGATVYLFSQSNLNQVESTTTDSNGNYIFEGHPDGDGTSQEWFVTTKYNDGTNIYPGPTKPSVSAQLSTAIPDSGLVHNYDAGQLSLTQGQEIDPLPDSEGGNDLSASGNGSYDDGQNTNIGEPAVFSDGVDDYWTSSSWGGTGGSELTLAFVAELLSTSDERFFQIGNGDNNIYIRVNSGSWEGVITGSGTRSGGSASTNSTYAGCLTYDGSNIILDIGNSNVIDASLSASAETGVSVSSVITGGSGYANIYGHQFLAYDGFKSGTERDDIISSLESKWNFTSATP